MTKGTFRSYVITEWTSISITIRSPAIGTYWWELSEEIDGRKGNAFSIFLARANVSPEVLNPSLA